MIKSLFVAIVVIVATTTTALAQNSNSSTTTRPRVTVPANNNRAAEPQKNTDVQQPSTSAPTVRRTETKPVVAETPGSQAVVAAFNSLVNGIRHADVKAVTNVYLNSPRLILFNSNGTVTKGWDQLRKNRESAYREIKDVKLDVRDLSITMLGRDGAVVSCLWTQSQTYKDVPETATGRMTLVFRRVGKDWKAIHLHTSPDKPDPSRVLPSEQPAASPTPAP